MRAGAPSGFVSVTETLGLVVLEAMASGLPVIAVAAGGVVDHLRDGANGLAVPPGSLTSMADQMKQRMVQLYRDPSLHRVLAADARRTAEQRSWRAELDRLEESYREVRENWQRRIAGHGSEQTPPAPTRPRMTAESAR